MENFKQFVTNEGLFDRTKAKLSGVGQTVGNVMKGVTGQSQTPGTRTGADARNDSISKGFDVKISKEITGLQNRLQKTLGVANVNEITGALTQLDPSLAEQYNSIVQLSTTQTQSPAKPEQVTKTIPLNR